MNERMLLMLILAPTYYTYIVGRGGSVVGFGAFWRRVTPAAA